MTTVPKPDHLRFEPDMDARLAKIMALHVKTQWEAADCVDSGWCVHMQVPVG